MQEISGEEAADVEMVARGCESGLVRLEEVVRKETVRGEVLG
jgi:hypothetical protein